MIGRELSFARSIRRGRPFNVLVQVTNRCNMKCSFCEFWPNGAPADRELTVDDYRRLSAELAGLGTCLVSIEGGEPFVRPDLTAIVGALARHHLTVLYTNGWFVDDDDARALFAAGLTQVGVSVDYADGARHDAMRRLPGAAERAWRAVETLRRAAPHGGRQVHVMTVLMDDNVEDVEPLLERTADLGVGFVATLLSTRGFRRGQATEARLPAGPVSGRLLALWRRHRHWRYHSDYLAGIDAFLAGGQDLPTCRAGRQGFNVDHLGNVAPCIEMIDRPAGNVRDEPLAAIHARMDADRAAVEACQDCWTACRGFGQVMGGGGSLRGWWQLSTRMRSR